MKSLVLKNVNAVLPDGVLTDCRIKSVGDRIEQISRENLEAEVEIDLAGKTVYPGFIDIHNHGAAGIDVNDAKAEDLLRISSFLSASGVLAWIPTLVPDSLENYRKAIGAIEMARELQKEHPISRIIGVHYEGVFANEKMCGALRPQYFRDFSKGDELSDLPKLKDGIHLMTLAPEVENGIELIGELIRQNWIVSIGHTKADPETLEQAFRKGARHLTHFFNAMTGIHHRELGVAGWALTKRDVTFDIIADGHHVHPSMLELAVRNKGTGMVSLISDSVAPTGFGDGYYDLWGEKISVINGRTRNKNGSIAGSVISMFDAVRFMLSLGFSETEVARMASLNPAKLLGIDDNYGSIEVGKRADLVVLDKELWIVMKVFGGAPSKFS